MAEATAAPAANEATAGKKGKGKLVMLIVVVLVLAGGGAGAWWWTSHAAPKVAAVPPPEPPHYLALDPPFVVNFEAEQVVRFLQITVQIMSRDLPTI